VFYFSLETMKESTWYMAEILNDVLSMQKIELGQLKMDFRNFDIRNLINNVYSNFRLYRFILLSFHCLSALPVLVGRILSTNESL